MDHARNNGMHTAKLEAAIDACNDITERRQRW